MSVNDEFSELFRQRDWESLHRALDSASPGRDPDERSKIAYWRAAALSAQDRCLEAIDVLTAIRTDCRCKTRVCTEIAENLRRLGRDIEAIEELKRAPMAEEEERFWALVVDAKYVLAHLQASNGLEVDKAILDAIPEGYIHITDRGQRISKSDLLNRISRRPSPRGRGRPA
jgi:hypothetical protein